MESRGAFRVSSSPEEDEARADRMLRELRGGGVFAEVRQKLEARVPALLAAFTPEELRELVAFAQTPLGVKTAQVWAPLTAEMFQRNSELYAPRAGEIAGEVFAEQMEFFGQRTAEIMRGTPPPPPAPRRRRGRN
jgi:hypothetical protein